MRHFYRATAILGIGFLLLAAGDAPDSDLAFLFPSADTTTATAPAETGATTSSQPVPHVVEEPIHHAEPELAPVLPEGGDLAAMVRAVRAMPAIERDRNLECLASAVYFEAKSEPLDGQLAVAQVILNRVEKGRFGGDICAVVMAPKQFSFVRGGQVPAARNSAQWETARAIAVIATAEGWRDVVGEATHFHAVYVNPGWRMQRVAQIGNHVFYR